MRFVWAGLGLLGCTGDKEREIPMWQDGVVLKGDCSSEIAEVDKVGVTVTHWRDFLPVPFTEPLPGDYGDVATDQDRFDELMTALYLYTSYPPDFGEDQVGFAWVRNEDTCAYEHVETHVNSKAEGGTVLDVTLRDPSMGCGNSCLGQRGGFLVVQSFPNDEPGSVCLRIEPGCSTQ
jgi:hypothetical protein